MNMKGKYEGNLSTKAINTRKFLKTTKYLKNGNTLSYILKFINFYVGVCCLHTHSDILQGVY